jgi:outer membrane protein assembly factor BamB
VLASTDDAVYAAGAGGRAASLTRDGERRWNVETDVDTLVSPTVAADTVHAGGGFIPRSSSLVALDAGDGSTRATFGTRQYDDGEVAYAGLTTGPVAVEGVLYVPTRAGDIYAFD